MAGGARSRRSRARTPAISVVMPAHNGERFIEDAVRGILAQRWDNFELVIGDDGSNDRTAAIIDQLAREDERIRVLRRRRPSGLANAANWVVRAARSDLVALAHADDISYPDRLVRQAAILEAYPDAVLVGAPADGLDTAGRIVHPPNLWRVLHPFVMAPFSHSSIMFRRSAFLKVGGYRESANYWEDLDLYWRMATVGRVLVLPCPVSGYRYSSGSARSRDHASEVERAVQRMYERSSAIAAEGAALAGSEAPPPSDSKLRPRVFVARAWVDVWNGRRTDVLPRMLRRARLGPNYATIEALCFLSWATLSPRSLRAALRIIVTLVNRRMRRKLKDRDAVEWRPF